MSNTKEFPTERGFTVRKSSANAPVGIEANPTITVFVKDSSINDRLGACEQVGGIAHFVATSAENGDFPPSLTACIDAEYVGGVLVCGEKEEVAFWKFTGGTAHYQGKISPGLDKAWGDFSQSWVDGNGQLNLSHCEPDYRRIDFTATPSPTAPVETATSTATSTKSVKDSPTPSSTLTKITETVTPTPPSKITETVTPTRTLPITPTGQVTAGVAGSRTENGGIAGALVIAGLICVGLYYAISSGIREKTSIN